MKKKILVIGANGQIGSALRMISINDKNFHWIFMSRSELDLEKDNITSILKERDFDILINCAAYTAVDKAEEQRDICYKINVLAVDTISQFCSTNSKILIHFSSDYVYHNDLNRPLIEGDQTAPKSVYAKSKLESEKVIIENSPPAVILRTSWLYNTKGKNFANTMINLSKMQSEVKVVDDQIGTPTYVPHLAHAIISILNNKLFIDRLVKFNKVEIFNYSNEGVCSWYDFAMAIFELCNSNIKCIPISTLEYPTPALRPSFSVLNKKRIKALINIEIPHWRSGLKDFFEVGSRY